MYGLYPRGLPGTLTPRRREFPVSPTVGLANAAAAENVHLDERAGHGVEAGGEHERVGLVQCAIDFHARRRDLLDRPLADVDQRDVVAIERLVVADVDAQPLAADRVLR